MNPWEVLGVPPTDDRKAIRRAYAEAVKRHRPDRDPEGYQKVRAAYDRVMAELDRTADAPWWTEPAQPSEGSQAAEIADGEPPATAPPPADTSPPGADLPAEALSPVAAAQDAAVFLESLTTLLDAEGLGDRSSWESLLEAPILLDLVARPQLSVQVFAALGEYCRRHPRAPDDRRFQWAARRLNEVFHWDTDELTLIKLFPAELIDSVMVAIAGRRGVASSQTQTPRASLIARAVLVSIAATVALAFFPWPDSPLDTARAHMQAAEFEEAESVLRSLRQLHPEDPVIARLLGVSLLEQGDHAAAIEALDAALFLRADDGLSHYFRGTAHEAAGDWLAAKADLTTAARLLPDFHDVQNRAAWLLATAPEPGARDGALAVELARAAVAASRAAYTVDTLAAAHAEAGDFEAAVARQQEAIDLLPRDAPEALRAGFLRRLDGYRDGRPFRAP